VNLHGALPVAVPRKSRDPQDICPGCGQLKTATAPLCNRCSCKLNAVEQEKKYWEDYLPGMRDRHRRFTLALDAGWTVKELMDLCRLDQLPTDEEILHRNPKVYIEGWWRENDI